MYLNTCKNMIIILIRIHVSIPGLLYEYNHVLAISLSSCILSKLFRINSLNS